MITDYLHGDSGAQQSDGIHEPVPSGLGFFTLTPDSYREGDDPSDDPAENFKTITRVSPLWLPPPLASKCLKTSVWHVAITVTPTGTEPDFISGTFDYDITAGTTKELTIQSGEVIHDEVINEPGWTNGRESVESDFGTFGGLNLSITEPTGDEFDPFFAFYGLQVMLSLGRWEPANRSTRPPDVGGAKPKWNDREGLDEVWIWGLGVSASVGYFGPGGSINPVFSTSVLNYEGEKSGYVNPPFDDADNAHLQVTISHVAFFDEF